MLAVHPRKDPSVTRATVAVIEDDPALAELIGELLADGGYRPCLLDGTAARLDEVAALRPSLIILDLVLRDQSGWGYLRQIRQDERLRDVPVLICSGDLEGLRERNGQLRADPMVASLTKPFALDDLERAVGGLIEGQRLPTWDDEDDVVLVADESARLVDASTAALRLLGLSLAELRHRQVTDIVAHSHEWTTAEWQRYRGEGRWEGEVVLRASDGGEIPAYSTAEILQSLGETWHLSRLQVTTMAPPEPTPASAGRSR
jgi:PAS domain S-box-containing protein